VIPINVSFDIDLINYYPSLQTRTRELLLIAMILIRSVAPEESCDSRDINGPKQRHRFHEDTMLVGVIEGIEVAVLRCTSSSRNQSRTNEATLLIRLMWHRYRSW
jgi:hypothetical protein